METTGQTPGGVVQFGKYLLDAEIARGGMARVFRARLRGLGGFEKTLVVKQILPELARDPRFVDMFVREANTLVAMSHPGIVPVYELGIVDGVYFLAMEHVDGATLAELLRDGPLPPELAAHIGVSICDALQYAHERFGVVHRDVTPRNVIINLAGHVRLLDFGIAAPTEGTATTEIFGGHGYMSPEQLRGETLTPASDVFALGAVLYEALTGTPAFYRGDAASSRAALLDGPPPTLDGAEVPADVAAAVSAALDREIAARPPSSDALGRRLRGWLAGAHPEGVARELGVLVGNARARQDCSAELSPAASATPGGRREPSGIVRTLAQSRVLDELLTGRIAPPAVEESVGTVPVSRQRPSARAQVDTRSARDAPSASDTASARDALGKLTRIALAMLSVAAIGVVAWRVLTPPSVAPLSTADAGALPAEPADAGLREWVADTDAGAEPDALTLAVADAGTDADAGGRGAPALLSVNAIPWASIRLDGRALGTTPRRNVQIPAGPHTLDFACPPLGHSARVQIRAVAGETTRVVVDLSTDPAVVTTE